MNMYEKGFSLKYAETCHVPFYEMKRLKTKPSNSCLKEIYDNQSSMSNHSVFFVNAFFIFFNKKKR